MIFRTHSLNTTVCNAMIHIDFADDIVKPSIKPRLDHRKNKEKNGLTVALFIIQPQPM